MKSCKLCNKKTENLEIHHIIPKSRGGSDNKNNLIELCSSCHGKAHDVSFKNDRGGLIKEGVDRKLKKNTVDKEWLNENANKVHDEMMKMYEKDEYNHMVMLWMIEQERMTPSHIREWFEEGKTQFKTMITLTKYY